MYGQVEENKATSDRESKVILVYVSNSVRGCT
jgi:hypothetical protein